MSVKVSGSEDGIEIEQYILSHSLWKQVPMQHTQNATFAKMIIKPTTTIITSVGGGSDSACTFLFCIMLVLLRCRYYATLQSEADAIIYIFIYIVIEQKKNDRKKIRSRKQSCMLIIREKWRLSRCGWTCNVPLLASLNDAV